VSFAAYLREIARSGDERGELTPEEAAQAFGAMLDGGVPELELGAMLVALRMKGESVGELLGCYEALGDRVHQLEPLPGTVRTVLIGTYGATRSQPNLTPLVALVLRRLGVPVLLHGTLESRGCVASAYILRELGVLPCATLAQAQHALDEERLAFVPTAVLTPGLADLLALRNRLGVPSTAHLLAKLIDPFRGTSVRLVGAAEPRSLAQTRELFLATGERAVVLRGAEDEPFADPRHRPRIEYFDDGAAVVLFDEEHASVDSTSAPPESIEVRATAAYIRRMLEGAAPLPLPIVNEIACCLFGAGLTADLNQAKAIAAVQTHSLAA
jgi:anthranilate phosphoribosyltransferase